jgi:membrane fusion protein, multidrug efflux system
MKTTALFHVFRFLGCLAAMLILAGCKQAGPPGAAAGKKESPEVGYVVIKHEQVTLTTELTGRVSPQLVAEIRPQVGGIIKKRLFEEGGQVKGGDVLYQIDPAPFQAALASAKAALAKAEANAFALRKKADRYRQLAPIKAISQQEFDDTLAAVNQAEADIASGKASVETASINLAYTRVTAPITGVIGRSSVTPGALVAANQAESLAVIQQLDPVFVDVTQSSAEVLRLKRSLASGALKGAGQGQAAVSLVLEDGSAYPNVGMLKFSEVSVDQTTGSVTLRAQFANPDQLLLPGMFVRGILQEGVREQALLVPQRGVSRNTAGKATALVVGENEVVEQRLLTAERTIGDAWLVRDGVQPGDRVIVEGVQRIRPGATVKAVPYTDKTPATINPSGTKKS